MGWGVVGAEVSKGNNFSVGFTANRILGGAAVSKIPAVRISWGFRG
jgi:hypothetical protein